MVTVLVAAAATIALAGSLFPSGLAVDYAVMLGRPDTMFSDKMAAILSEDARYGADSVDSRVQTAVVGALMLYWEEGSDVFEMIMPEKALIIEPYTHSSWMLRPLRWWRTARYRALQA